MSPCPTAQVLEAFLEDSMSGAEHEALSLHISGCVRCQETLERLTEYPVVLPYQSTGPARSCPPRVDADGSQAAFLSSLKLRPPKSEAAGQRHSNLSPISEGGSAVSNELPAIAGYEILSEVGRGGMGVVYRARQAGLNRIVALKMILAGTHAAPKELARFRQEAEAVARLRHSHIVQIYDIGEQDGVPYIALEFMEAGNLMQRTRGDPQPLVPSVRLIEVLARAVHFAHNQGIVHRDLKPANILLTIGTPQEMTIAEDRSEAVSEASDATTTIDASLPFAHRSLPTVAKITDFGLAKRLDEPSSRTQSGEIVGTPSYMAPEQAAGRAIGPPADVYALGAILYELITGRAPFKGPTALDTVLQVLHEDPVRPRFLRPDLPRDLETICLKCLSKDPGKRYRSAQALADDLDRFRHGRPIRARPVRLPERTWKWMRRRPVVSGLMAGMISVAMLGFAGVTWQWQVALAEKQEKETQRLQAVHARGQAEQAQIQEAGQRRRVRAALYFSRIAQCQLHLRLNDYAAARENLATCLPRDGHEDWRAWEWYFLSGLMNAELIACRHHEGGAGGAAAFEGQGRWIVSTVGTEPEADESRLGEVRIWDACMGTTRHVWPVPGAVQRMVIQPGGSVLALSTTDGMVLIYDALTGRELHRRKAHDGMVTGLAFSADGRLVISAGWDRLVQIWDTASGEIRQTLKGHADRVQTVAAHPGGQYVATGSWDGTIRLWNRTRGTEVRTLRGHNSPVYCVAFSSDGRLLASAGSNGTLKIWEVEAGRTIQSRTGQSGAVLSVAFSPDGRYLAYGNGDATVRVWDIESGVQRVIFRGHTGPVESVCFSPDGQRLVSFSPGPGEVKVWDLTRHPEYATFARTGADVEAIQFTADGQRVRSLSLGGKLQTWDAVTGVLLDDTTLPLSDVVQSPAVPAVFAPGAEKLAARCRDDSRLVRIWDTESGNELRALHEHTMPVRSIRFSADGTSLVTCACDANRVGKPHEVIVWDWNTGTPRHHVSGKGLIFTANFSPNNDWLAWGGEEGEVTIVSLKTWRKMTIRSKNTSDITGLAFSSDSRLLATAGFNDRIIQLWQVNVEPSANEPSWQPVQTLTAPRLLCDLTFDRDGKRLLGASRDNVKMWSTETGQEVLTLRGAPQRHWDPAFNARLVFSPDGARLAGSNWDETISLWEAELQPEDSRQRRQRAADARAHYWHLQEAEICLDHKNAAAARFHLQRLDDVKLPGPWQARKLRAEANLASAGHDESENESLRETSRPPS